MPRYRLHPDTVTFVGNEVGNETDGASSITVPDGANGIMFQGHSELPTSDHTYISFTQPLTDTTKGLEVPELDWLTIWFNPKEVKTIYIFNESNADFRYQFIRPSVERY